MTITDVSDKLLFSSETVNNGAVNRLHRAVPARAIGRVTCLFRVHQCSGPRDELWHDLPELPGA